jgi:hypothetical protein
MLEYSAAPLSEPQMSHITDSLLCGAWFCGVQYMLPHILLHCTVKVAWKFRLYTICHGIFHSDTLSYDHCAIIITTIASVASRSRSHLTFRYICNRSDSSHTAWCPQLTRLTEFTAHDHTKICNLKYMQHSQSFLRWKHISTVVDTGTYLHLVMKCVMCYDRTELNTS